MKPKRAPAKMKNKMKLYALLKPMGLYTFRAMALKSFFGGRVEVTILREA